MFETEKDHSVMDKRLTADGFPGHAEASDGKRIYLKMFYDVAFGWADTMLFKGARLRFLRREK